MPKYDWDALDFSLHPTDKMFIAECELGGQWHHEGLVDFGPIPISPAAGALNYAQSVFEGMKAFRRHDDSVALFRPEKNAQRMIRSAEAICIPPVPESLFLNAVTSTITANEHYIPPCGKGAFYLRPIIFADGDHLGCRPAPHYRFVVYASPVGNYFKGELAPIKLFTSYDYHRAASKGTGHAKYAGNYAGSYASMLAAKAAGYQSTLYLDAQSNCYIEEAGTANIFFVSGNRLITPQLGSILEGITRESIITLAEHKLGMSIEQRNIDINEISDFDECFCTGTAAVITPVSDITTRNDTICYQNGAVGPITQTLYDMYRGIQLGDQEDSFGWIKTVITSTNSLA